MKTVSGKVVSSHPMSLSRAAKYLSAFTASSNEASPAFAAYLRRTSDAFNQLVQLYKHCNIIPTRQHSNNLNNIDNHDDVLTHATATSVANAVKGKTIPTFDDDVNVDDHSRYDSLSVGIEGDVSDVRSDLNKSKKKKKNKKAKDVELNGVDDGIEVKEVKSEMGGLVASEEVTNNLADEGVASKKSKKKRRDVDLSHDAVNPDVVGNKADGLDSREESKKKKKSKRDKHQKENHSGATEAVKDVQVHPRSNKSSEQIGEIKLENKHQVLSEKKRLYVAEEGENGHDMETEVVRRKESRKRKHERVADGVLEGSQEAVKSKKKKL